METGRRFNVARTPLQNKTAEGITADEAQLIRIELTQIRKLLDEFCGTFLNAKFPYGKPTDRWARR